MIGQPTQEQADEAASGLGCVDGPTISGVGGDLSVPNVRDADVAQTIAGHGRIDILVNKAGIAGPRLAGWAIDHAELATRSMVRP